jgi:DNA modification methylase
MLEENRVYCGDCLDLMREIPDGSVDVVITDPPYGLGNKMKGGSWGYTKDEPMEWDSSTAHKAIQEAIRVSRNQIIWGGNYYQLPISRCWLSWDKPDSPPSMSDFELAWTNFDKISSRFRYPIGGYNKERVGHPTQKPVALMVWCIEKYTNPDDLVLDPFIGSGTTAVAAIRTGRRFIGIELDPGYCDIARKRIAAEQAQCRLAL